MSEFSLDVLQSYFDDLLTPETIVNEPVALQAVTTLQKLSPLAATVVGAEVAEPEPAAEAESLRVSAVVGDLARQNLARLLASKPVEVVTEEQPDVMLAPLDAAPPKPALPSFKSAEVVPDSSDPVDEPVDLDWSGSKWSDNGRPSWAQQRFEVLLFEVAGLTLAVPLVSLGQIQPLTEELTPLFGQADWFIGLQPTPVGRVRVINTARFVMPERYEEHFIDAAKYVVSLADSPWGLAVDAVNQPITLNPEDVKWRGERSKRPWLAGTIKQHMCALLDIPTMRRLLQHSEQTQSKIDPLKA
jgi:purine-binding chemotaxis protein CheW